MAEPSQMVFIIADITGYTRFMTATAKELVHSQAIITQLLECIIKRVEIPLRIAKLEGDAVFLYAPRPADVDDAGWADTLRTVRERLPTFFDAFRAELALIAASVFCIGAACKHVKELKLKIVVHAGQALSHEVAGFRELSGVDVIIVHRLLKNRLPAGEYLLFTDAAFRALEVPASLETRAHDEKLDDIGAVKVHVHHPGGAPLPAVRASYVVLLGESYKHWFGQFPLLLRPRRESYHHLEGRVSWPSRILLPLMFALFTPLYLPITALAVAFRRR